jgi:carbon monoxide dehydrogenase subunit G
VRLEHSFTVPVPVDDAWRALLDLPRVAPCMPGATLTGVEGDTFTGTVKVKVGPIGLTYSGKGRFVERDEAAHRVVIDAGGRDIRSAGTASATVTATLVPEGDATRAEVVTDLTVTGRPAQFGRGMISDIGGKLIGQFADCLADTLTGPATAAAPEPLPGAEVASPPPASAPAAGSPPGAVAAPAEEPEPAAVAVPARPAEPMDLLGLTAGTATARRLVNYGLAALVLVVLRWMLRQRRSR